jgi:hypothetical protein
LARRKLTLSRLSSQRPPSRDRTSAKPDRTRNEADRENGKRLQDAGQGVRRRKIQLGEDQRGHLAIQQEIVPFDCRADRAGDHRAAQLGAVIEVGKWDCGDVGYGLGDRPEAGDPFLVAS